jgi:hypothetical protein
LSAAIVRFDPTRRPRKAVARRDYRRRLTAGDPTLRPQTAAEAYGQVLTRLRDRVRHRRFEGYYARLQARIRGPRTRQAITAATDAATIAAMDPVTRGTVGGGGGGGLYGADVGGDAFEHPVRPFAPRVTRTSAALAAGRPGTVAERAAVHAARKAERLEKLREERDREIMREVRAHPVTSHTRRRRGGGGPEVSHHGAFERGSKFAVVRERDLARRRAEMDAEAMAECTFSPQISERSRKLAARAAAGSDVVSRTREMLERRERHVEALRAEREAEEQREIESAKARAAMGARSRKLADRRRRGESRHNESRNESTGRYARAGALDVTAPTAASLRRVAADPRPTSPSRTLWQGALRTKGSIATGSTHSEPQHEQLQQHPSFSVGRSAGSGTGDAAGEAAAGDGHIPLSADAERMRESLAATLSPRGRTPVVERRARLHYDEPSFSDCRCYESPAGEQRHIHAHVHGDPAHPLVRMPTFTPEISRGTDRLVQGASAPGATEAFGYDAWVDLIGELRPKDR